MKRLLIIGAGGFGREVLAWARACAADGNSNWQVGGFIDDNATALDGFDVDIPIVGTIADYHPQLNDVFVCAIGFPKLRRQCVTKLLERGANFLTLIHPTVVIGERVTIGTGVVICPYCVLTTDIQIGDHTALNIRCSVGHDATIGSFCQLSSFSDVTGGVQIQDDVFLGSHATILPNVVVESGATVGAGSVAISRVRTQTTVFGVPAKLIKA